jgi:hypothetical protein
MRCLQPLADTCCKDSKKNAICFLFGEKFGLVGKNDDKEAMDTNLPVFQSSN